MADKKQLIYKEDLLETVLNHFGCDLVYYGKDLQFCQEAIDMAPAVDAVEVVHSQWDTVFYESHGTLSSYTHICPECKYLYRNLRFKGHKYCPECGAKMDR